MDDPPTKSLIEDLLDKPFAKRSLSKKHSIIRIGRPLPKLEKLRTEHKDKDGKRVYTRRFKEAQYSFNPWLTGCENQRKLFCWPCLLFPRTNTSWNTTGNDNLNHLSTLQKKHKQSAAHLQSVLKLARFGENTKTDASSSQQPLIEDLNTLHNIQVKKNLEILTRLIDTICLLSNQDIPFVSSLNQSNYIELLHLLAKYDTKLLLHFETETEMGFKASSKEIQNDLIRAIAELLDSHISEKLEQSEFVAIMIDETFDNQLNKQLSVVFRYYHNKNIHESFMGFFEVSSKRTADDLVSEITDLLLKYNVQDKLVAQTYDGTSIMSGQMNELQTKIMNICPKALLVHCYAHSLISVLSQGLSNIKECRYFFNILNGLASFGSPSSKTTESLEEFVKRKIPSLDTTKWCFSSQLINIVCTYEETIQQYFESIRDDETFSWEANDRMAAIGYCDFLEKNETVFLLIVFSKLFSNTEELFDALQTVNMDMDFCIKQINKLGDFFKYQKEEDFEEIWKLTLHTVLSDGEKRNIRNDQFDSNETKYRELFFQIVDNLIIQITNKFSSFEKLKYFDLLNGNKLDTYREKKDFPEDLILDMVKNYQDVFELNQLKNELAVFYENADATIVKRSKTITPIDVLIWLESKNIEGSFDQVYKLAKLICTIPAVTQPIEESCCALKRIKTYLKITEDEESSSYLALMSIEKKNLKEMKNTDGFYNRVIEQFLKIEKRPDFIFR